MRAPSDGSAGGRGGFRSWRVPRRPVREDDRVGDPDMHTVTIDDVRGAADRIDGHVVRTPMAHSSTLSEITGADVFVKFENLQFTGVVQGAWGAQPPGAAPRRRRRCRRGVGRQLRAGCRSPRHQARYPDRDRDAGDDAVDQGHPHRPPRCGDHSVRRDVRRGPRTRRRRLPAERGFELLSPFDDPAVIAGQGTVALEMLADEPDLDVIVTPVGGGGLQAGTAVAARSISPGIELVGRAERTVPGSPQPRHR